MLWYGKYSKLNFKKIYKRRKFKSNLTTKKVSFIKHSFFSTHTSQYFIPIPKNWGLIILNSNNPCNLTVTCLFYSNIYYFRYLFPLGNLQLNVDLNTNLLHVVGLHSPSSLPFLLNSLVNIFRSFNLFFFKKN